MKTFEDAVDEALKLHSRRDCDEWEQNYCRCAEIASHKLLQKLIYETVMYTIKVSLKDDSGLTLPIPLDVGIEVSCRMILELGIAIGQIMEKPNATS